MVSAIIARSPLASASGPSESGGASSDSSELNIEDPGTAGGNPQDPFAATRVADGFGGVNQGWFDVAVPIFDSVGTAIGARRVAGTELIFPTDQRLRFCDVRPGIAVELWTGIGGAVDGRWMFARMEYGTVAHRDLMEGAIQAEKQGGVSAMTEFLDLEFARQARENRARKSPL